MLAISLQSGSNGNCMYVETKGVRLLFDAGITSVQAAGRLSAHGINIRDVNALIISHDHADHVRHAGVYQRRFGLPVHITPSTMQNAAKRHGLGQMDDINYFRSGDVLKFGDVSVHTIPSPHDGVDGSVFVVCSGDKKLGIWTDLGHVFKELFSQIASLDAVFLESNYDREMLANGPYPWFLKQRIQGPSGHISNVEAAELLLSGGRLKWACLAHLSKHNNNPHIALQTHRRLIGDALPLYVASRHEATGVMTL
ncbi:MAG: MBL fold metallo-hydrolase [Nitrospiraceae bacterium]|nr:MAG: MBL fold metallo-hydrolase [Nitrospiraceae bacterium]